MKKIVAVAVTLSIILTSCWDLTDPEKLGLVTVIGVDISSNGQIKLVLHETPYQKQTSGQQSEGSGGGASIKLHKAEASTISEAMEKIASSDFRRIYLTHASAIILSEEFVSSNGLTPIIDYLERTPQIRRSIWVLISKKGQFNKIFNSGNKIEQGVDLGKIVKEMIGNKEMNSYLTAKSLTEFFTFFWETGSEPYTSGIGLVNLTLNNEEQDTESKSDKLNSCDLIVENTAVFKNKKMVGWMNNEESRGLLWVMGEIKGGNITVKLDEKDVVLKILKADSKIKPIIKDDKLKINIQVKVTSDVNESQKNIDFEQSRVIDKLQELQAVQVKRQILAAIDKSKNINSDVFGFGNLFFGKYPEYWKQIDGDWYGHYMDVDMKIDVKSTIDHMGLIRKTEEGS